jgi:hypothetical protein
MFLALSELFEYSFLSQKNCLRHLVRKCALMGFFTSCFGRLMVAASPAQTSGSGTFAANFWKRQKCQRIKNQLGNSEY